MIRTLGLVIALTMVAGAASAADAAFQSHDNAFLRAPEFTPHTTVGATTSAVAAPEIDPASTVAGVMLMLGTLAVLRGRRATQKHK
jgi:hypothetical protein